MKESYDYDFRSLVWIHTSSKGQWLFWFSPKQTRPVWIRPGWVWSQTIFQSFQYYPPLFTNQPTFDLTVVWHSIGHKFHVNIQTYICQSAENEKLLTSVAIHQVCHIHCSWSDILFTGFVCWIKGPTLVCTHPASHSVSSTDSCDLTMATQTRFLSL